MKSNQLNNTQFDFYVKSKEVNGIPIATGLDWFKVIGNFISFATVVIQGFTQLSKNKQKIQQVQTLIKVYPKTLLSGSLIKEIEDILVD